MNLVSRSQAHGPIIPLTQFSRVVVRYCPFAPSHRMVGAPARGLLLGMLLAGTAAATLVALAVALASGGKDVKIVR